MTIRQPVVRMYAAGVATPVVGYNAVEIAYDQHGPAQARLTLPRMVGTASNPLLKAGALFPQGEGVLVEIDARALGTNENSATIGVPDVWLGRVTDPQGGDSTAPEVELSLNGPMAELADETIPVRATPMSGPAGVIAAELVRSHPVDLRIDVGTLHRGRSITTPVSGSSVADTLTQLAEQAGDDFYFVPLPGESRWRMDWTDGLSPVDYTGTAGGRAITITDDGSRQNARISLAYAFARTRTDALTAGGGWRNGGPLAVQASVTGLALGKRAALSALVSTAIVQRVAGGKSADYRPELSALPMLESAAAAQVRRLMRPAVPFQAEILDTALWPYMRPLALVLTRMPDETSGLYANAIAQIRTVTFGVTAPLKCTISGELWSTE